MFVLAPCRAHDVPEEHLGPAATCILNVDRYSAYKAMTQVKEGRILLAFCWALSSAAISWAWPADWPSEAGVGVCGFG